MFFGQIIYEKLSFQEDIWSNYFNQGKVPEMLGKNIYYSSKKNLETFPEDN